MTERCESCGEGKLPANPDKLDWETLCAQPTWQCNDCEYWNGEQEMTDKKPYEGKANIFDELEGYAVFDYDFDKMRKIRNKLHALLDKKLNEEQTNG